MGGRALTIGVLLPRLAGGGHRADRKPPHCSSKRAPPGMPCSPGGCHRALVGSGEAHRRTSLNMVTM
jgi:hypothetical protein